MKPVAVIILNWNGEKLLREFLPSVVANTDPDIADVIVADNGSTDGSRELLSRDFPQVRLLAFDENLGYAGGYNRALRETGYRYTVLLNSDVETPRGWLGPLYQFLESHPDAAACQPKILSYKERHRFEYAGAAGGYIDRNGYPYCRGRIFDTVEEDKGQYDTPAEVFWATGAALMVRTDLYTLAGGLDERFFAHMEEIDLCCRIHAAGRRVCFVPDSAVFHVGGASLAQGDPQKTYLNFRNNLLLIHKNLPEKTGRRRTFVRRLVDTAALMMFLVKGDFGNVKAVWRAHRDFPKMAREYRDFPAYDVLRSLPGSGRRILLDRYLFLSKKDKD